MGKLKSSFFFLLGAVFFAACGTAEIKFPYKFFHLSPTKTWDFPGGKLIGDGQTFDLTDCKPVRNNQGQMVQRCLVFKYDEFNRAVADYKNTKQQLIDCQRGR